AQRPRRSARREARCARQYLDRRRPHVLRAWSLRRGRCAPRPVTRRVGHRRGTQGRAGHRRVSDGCIQTPVDPKDTPQMRIPRRYHANMFRLTSVLAAGILMAGIATAQLPSNASLSGAYNFRYLGADASGSADVAKSFQGSLTFDGKTNSNG